MTDAERKEKMREAREIAAQMQHSPDCEPMEEWCECGLEALQDALRDDEEPTDD